MMKHKQATKVQDITRDFFQAFQKLLHQVDLDVMERIVWRLSVARKNGSMIYLAGNGGSASTASHWVNDLGKATKKPGRAPIRVVSLNDNISWLTALANDEGYERVFTGQLENLAQEDDILIVISASGNSPNLVQAVDLAKTRNVFTIGLLGFDGGVLKDKVDECLLLPTEKGAYGLVESAHGLLIHVLTTCLMECESREQVESAD
jgi:D-sedoheptulose 7-phosphate isomerase